MIPQNHIITCLQILAFYKTSCIYSLRGACSSQMIHKMKMVEGKSVCCKIIIITQTFHLTQTSLSRIAALWHTNMVILHNLLLPLLPVNFNSIWPNTLINKHLFDQAWDQIFESSSRINIFFLKLLSQYKISLARSHWRKVLMRMAKAAVERTAAMEYLTHRIVSSSS